MWKLTRMLPSKSPCKTTKRRSTTNFSSKEERLWGLTWPLRTWKPLSRIKVETEEWPLVKVHRLWIRHRKHLAFRSCIAAPFICSRRRNQKCPRRWWFWMHTMVNINHKRNKWESWRTILIRTQIWVEVSTWRDKGMKEVKMRRQIHTLRWK